MQAYVFGLMAIYLFYINIDLRQLQVVVGLILLCLALTFVLITSQGDRKS